MTEVRKKELHQVKNELLFHVISSLDPLNVDSVLYIIDQSDLVFNQNNHYGTCLSFIPLDTATSQKKSLANYSLMKKPKYFFDSSYRCPSHNLRNMLSSQETNTVTFYK